ncbi:MAG TPA: ECF transporter S component [Thermoleophilaceae bacterium]|nr:ECF transporter S component [Thermoleophilaceae bacterium]
MTWQLASFLLLGGVLAIGFVWYERSRPSARVLALVAALAALAVVGRLAFAAFPNVKPTTDIVLIAGYALGGAAGFAVGAITPLASNVFLGHGPWTPWQMVAWGGVGVGGALLARAMRGRELGRWPLAAACGLAGLAFGAVMDTYQWTLAAEQDLATWIAVAGTSLPYNLAHAIGNVVFCLLIGPALLRALSRYRRRFEVRWAPAAAAAGAVLLMLVVPSGASAASAAGRAADWLERAQNADGGFGSDRGQSSGALFTGWASLGLAAGGVNPRDAERRGNSAIDWVRRRAGEIKEVGEVERTILLVEAAGLDARRFGGRDLVARLERYRRADGSYSGFVSYTAFGILAVRATGSDAVRRPARWLAKQRNDDGGFGVAPGSASDVDNSAPAIQALAAAGRRGSDAVRDAVGFLRGAQNPDGGFGLYPGRSSNSQSTAYAVQALVAAGRNPARFRAAGRSPIAYLRARQRANGSVAYSKTSDQTPVWVTAQAVMAFAREPLPIEAVPRAARARPAPGPAAAPEPAPPAQDRRKPPEREDRGERSDTTPRAEQSTKGRRAESTAYARTRVEKVLAGGTAPPAAGPPRTDASWLGVSLTLVAAALGVWGGRRLRASR